MGPKGGDPKLRLPRGKGPEGWRPKFSHFHISRSIFALFSFLGGGGGGEGGLLVELWPRVGHMANQIVRLASLGSFCASSTGRRGFTPSNGGGPHHQPLIQVAGVPQNDPSDPNAQFRWSMAATREKTSKRENKKKRNFGRSG